TPAVADSGCGTPGLQRLLRPPMSPACPSEQKPSSPPISPMPGIEQGPETAGLVAASVRAAATRWGARPAAMCRPDAPPGPAWLTDGAAPRTRPKSTASRTSAIAVLRGTRRGLGIGGLQGIGGSCGAPPTVRAPGRD